MAALEPESTTFEADQAAGEVQTPLGSRGNGHCRSMNCNLMMTNEPEVALHEEDDDEDECSKDGLKTKTVPLKKQTSKEKLEEFVFKVWEGRWSVLPYELLPDWLKDNDFLLNGHRPPLPSFQACFLSIFRLHTETFNIWTHLIGFLFFLCSGLAYMFSPNIDFVSPLQEKVVLGLFFMGAILCLCFSWIFHTVYCHSKEVALTFSKLDYCGIAFLIMGSFVPWIYYSFYCSPRAQLMHLMTIMMLGLTSIAISQWDCFATTPYRVVRVGVFLGLGLSGIIPFLHFLMISGGFMEAAITGQLGGIVLMAVLYIMGGLVYTCRVPERFFPGKCDIWFHSHQIFHVLVVVAAIVHLHCISQMQALHSSSGGVCSLTNEVEPSESPESPESPLPTPTD
ncbi:adiponectin receptor protein 2-like [Ambystoma mexicanum]|uniref:adiponectin receptor protein 2-like n=1 Tax=Ambystoma mexicanum TaxID=8296 RepID=UPI0037E87240